MSVLKKHRQIGIKMKTLILFVSMILILSIAMIFWTRIAFEDYVKNAEISRFRSSITSSLRIEAKNYYTSKDEAAFNKAITEIKKLNPGIISVFITVDNGFVVGDSYKSSEKILASLDSESKKNDIANEHSIIDVDGEKQLIVSFKEKFDPYMLHFSFSADFIKARTRGLAMKVSFVIGMIALLVIMFGSAFIYIIIAPIEKVAKDAERLSLGDLKIKLRKGSHSEAGRIGNSLSRLKESILYSMKRLNMQ